MPNGFPALLKAASISTKYQMPPVSPASSRRDCEDSLCLDSLTMGHCLSAGAQCPHPVSTVDLSPLTYSRLNSSVLLDN